jgi:hypothetical protein
MAKSKIRKSEIQITSFEDNVSKVAFDLFREWTKNAKIQYTEIDFTIKDESVLVKDLRNCIKSGIKSLLESSKYRSGIYLPQWDYGYFLGFIEGNLGKHWNQEYIVKHSEDYKTFAALKVVTNYLDFDKILEIRYDTLLEHFMTEDANIANLKVEVTKKEIEFSKKIKTIKTSDKGKIRAILDNLMLKYIVKIADKGSNKEFMDDVQNYISYQKFKDIINENKTQNTEGVI